MSLIRGYTILARIYSKRNNVVKTKQYFTFAYRAVTAMSQKIAFSDSSANLNNKVEEPEDDQGKLRVGKAYLKMAKSLQVFS